MFPKTNHIYIYIYIYFIIYKYHIQAIQLVAEVQKKLKTQRSANLRISVTNVSSFVEASFFGVLIGQLFHFHVGKQIT